MLNEYTDWSRPLQQPVALLDSLLDILGDALVVSPLVRAADLNLQLNRLASSSWPQLAELPLSRHTKPFSTYNLTGSPLGRSWAVQLATTELQSIARATLQRSQPHKVRAFCYLFAHQQADHSNLGGMPGVGSDRLASAHGDELSFIFGAPLYSQIATGHETLGYFGGNYSRAEVVLSEAVIAYWSNFVKFGYVIICFKVMINLKVIKKKRDEKLQFHLLFLYFFFTLTC